MESEKQNTETKKNEKPLWLEYTEAFLVALVLAFFIRTFFVQAFKIPSESMLNTLLVGDHLLATKFDYGVYIPFTDIQLYKGHDPQRGDIIILSIRGIPASPSSNVSSAFLVTSLRCVTSSCTGMENLSKKTTSVLMNPTTWFRCGMFSDLSLCRRTAISAWATTGIIPWIPVSGDS